MDPKHVITVTLEIEHPTDLDNALRFVLGLQGLISPTITLTWNCERSAVLDELASEGRDYDPFDNA